MGKTLGEIIEAVRDGERPDYEDLRYAIRAMDSNEAVPGDLRWKLDNLRPGSSGVASLTAAEWDYVRAALSQQPGVPDLAMAMHWIDRYATGIDDECQMDRVCEALGVTLAAAQKDGA